MFSQYAEDLYANEGLVGLQLTRSGNNCIRFPSAEESEGGEGGAADTSEPLIKAATPQIQ
jgi:hypothetical protein